MESFIYEIHCHTNEGSTCANISGAELAHLYKEKGYSGICITDHFFKSNTTVPDNLPWQERIDLFCQGYENCKEEGAKIGLDVFLGWEFTHKGTDFLTYGLGKNWLLNHPDLHKYKINEYCDLVHESGGFIVHAHPFWDSIHVNRIIRLLPGKVDAVEINNPRRSDFENERAKEFADNYGLYKIAASDIHHRDHDQFNGIRLKRPVENSQDLITEIKKNNIELIIDIEKSKKMCEEM